MGAGIGQLCAQKGYDVDIIDTSDEIVQKAKSKVQKGLERRIEKGKITQEDMESTLSRMHWSTDIEIARDSDFVIEAVFENMDLKKDIFGRLSEICSADTILASNTTALSISEIASAASHPDRVIGMHFFNPAVIMKLVEIIRGDETSDATV